MPAVQNWGDTGCPVISTGEQPHCSGEECGNVEVKHPTFPRLFFSPDGNFSNVCWFVAPVCAMIQEPVFVPKAGSDKEGDGYLLALINNYDSMSSELHLLDLDIFEKARAIIKLPVRLRQGLHGNWVDSGDMLHTPLLADWLKRWDV